MASDEDDDYAPRDPLTPLYTPPDENVPAPNSRSLRQGPLGARLSQREYTPPAPAPPPLAYGAPAPSYTPGGATQLAGEPATPAPSSRDTASSGLTGRQGASWGRVTGLLRLDERVTGALHADLSFGATWSSRSEMLRACLDEYYRLAASYNEARRLLEQSGSDIEALRGEQATAALRLREVEARLEFHSRTELRAVYLGAAEVEARLFRAEEERDLLRSRAELLEGFMAFLSRIIATVRAIPHNVVIGGDAPPVAGATGANGANGAAGAQASPRLPVDASPQETLLYDGLRNRRPRDISATIPPAGSVGKRAAADGHEIEEFILDEDEVALLASSEFEIIEILDDEPAVTDESGTPEAGGATRGATDQPAGEAPGETASEADPGPEDGEPGSPGSDQR